MANLYTGRTPQELQAITVADYRWFLNSLRNWMPGSQGGTEVADMAEYLETADTSPRQGKALGLPSIDIEDEDAYFAFPTNLKDFTDESLAWSFEAIGVPAHRGDPLTITEELTFIGETTETDNISIRPDNHVVVNMGANQVSDDMVWAMMDAPLHFVFTREAGTDPDFHVYCNGCEVSFTSQKAGDNAFTADARIYNWSDENQNTHACYGHHHRLRFFSDELSKADALWLFDQAQRLYAHEKFPIPVYGEEA